MDNATTASSTVTEELYHTVPEIDLSQIMLFFLIAFVAGGFSKIVAYLVGKCQDRKAKKKEEKAHKKSKVLTGFQAKIPEDCHAKVYISAAKIKTAGDADEHLYIRGFGVTAMGIFAISPVRVENLRNDGCNDLFPTESVSLIDPELGIDNMSFETPVEVLKPDK